MITRALFIVEGADDEFDFIRYCFDRVGLKNNYSIFRYGCNIYNFYDCLMANQKDGDFSSLDVLTVLKEAAESKHNKLPNASDIKLLDSFYTDIFLVFDLDNHDTVHTAEEKRSILAHLSNFFVDSTDQGMLIVNSPMVESYRDLSVLPNNKVQINDDIKVEESQSYKDLVGRRSKGVPPLSKYSKDSFLITSSLFYHKLSSLIGTDSIEDFTCKDYLQVIGKFISKGEVPIISWISLVPFYFVPKIFDEAINIPVDTGFHSLKISKVLKNQ